MTEGRKGSVWIEGDSLVYIDENGEEQSAALGDIEEISLKNKKKLKRLESRDRGFKLADEDTEVAVGDITAGRGVYVHEAEGEGDVLLAPQPSFEEFDKTVWSDEFSNDTVDSMWTQESGIWEESDSVIYTVDAEPSGGNIEWYWNVGDRGVYSSPTVVDGTVYVGSNDGNFYARDATNGEKRWIYSTGDRVESSPTVVDGTVYVGSNDGNLYALDTSDGTEEWIYSTGDDVRSSPTVADGTVYVGSNDGNMYALDAVDGSQQWAHDINYPQLSSPTVFDGTVYIVAHDIVYALDASDGTEQWTYSSFDRHYRSSLTVSEGIVYFGTYVFGLNDYGVFYALNASDGTKEWEKGTTERIYSSPTVADGTVYFGTDYGQAKVWALDAYDGSNVWNLKYVADSFSSSPTVADGTVYIGADGGGVGERGVYAIDASTGDREWYYQTRGAVESSPTVSDGTVYVGDNSGRLYAIGTASEDANGEGSRNLLGTLGHNDLFIPDGTVNKNNGSNPSPPKPTPVLRNAQYTNESTGVWTFVTERKGDQNNNRTVICNVNGDTGEGFSGYSVVHRSANESFQVDFERVDGGKSTTLLEIGADSDSDSVTWNVARRPGGEWECYMDGQSKGTVVDDTYGVDGSYFELRTGDKNTIEWGYSSYELSRDKLWP